MAIGRYESLVKQLRLFVGNVLRELSIQISGDKNKRTWIRLEPCVNTHTLKTVQQFLTPEKLQELYACVYDLPESAFSKEALIAHQQLVLHNGKVPGESGTRNKPAMEEEVKADRQREKAQDPTNYA
jgi:hypothetical protein